MAAPASERTLELEPTPASAGAARRLLREALDECGCEQWLDAGQLAVSEVVTNGVLHAHTRLVVTVLCSADELRVEVQDSNPLLPAQRQYGRDATTGRGMALLAAVTTSHGVRELVGGGKAVWFTIADAATGAGEASAPADQGALAAGRAQDGAPSAPSVPDGGSPLGSRDGASMTGAPDGAALAGPRDGATLPVPRDGAPASGVLEGGSPNSSGTAAADDEAARGPSDRTRTSRSPAGRRLTLVGLPPTLWQAAAQHHDALLRELALHRMGHEQANDDLGAADRARAAIRTAVDGAVAEARATGQARRPLPLQHPSPLDAVPDLIDLDIDVHGDDPAVDFAVLQDVLDEAERLAAAGLLLARPGLPEIVAVRDWAAESVIAQLAGQPPAPWPGTAAERFAQRQDERARELDWDATPVRDATRGAVAADDANRILAISRPLARELGWDPDDLIGRRVVAIVPPQFREAHVAGFTRHLTTGQAHALDVRLELPVLRADATEVLCEFYIQAHRSRSGRAVYIAWVTPLPAPPA